MGLDKLLKERSSPKEASKTE